MSIKLQVMGGKLQVIVGGAYGSEGKGAISAYLADYEEHAGRGPMLGVRVAGPNAGHTVWGTDKAGEPMEFKLRQIPVSAVSNRDATVAIAAGSEIDIAVLFDELETLDEAGYDVTSRLLIDKQATVLTPDHIRQEQVAKLQAQLGSTAKGIGAARADRIWRGAKLWGDQMLAQKPGWSADTAVRARQYLSDNRLVQIEGTQGYGLGLHAGSYPYCTTSDCRAIDFLSMAGISPWAYNISDLEIWVVFRTRPIRVAGNSGAIKGETTWSELNLPEERTTVTNKVRRVGEWDAELAKQAVESNGGGSAIFGALTMLDQVFPEISGWTSDDWYDNLGTELGERVLKYVAAREQDAGCQFQILGTSPTTVIDRRFDNYSWGDN